MVLAVRGVSDWLRVKLLWLVVVSALVIAQAAGGQETEPAQQTNAKIQQLAALERAQPQDETIGSGDLLHIEVFDVPELTRDVRVSDTGDISFPLLTDRISVAGSTPFQLQSKLEKMLIEHGLVSHPNVSVFVREQNSEPVTVVGAVNHPTVYQVVRPTTLLEVLSAAGGISDRAGDTVIVTRPMLSNAAVKPASMNSTPQPEDQEQQQKITIRLRDLLESGDTVYNIPVYGGDTITVPPAGIVYILGFGVAQPGGYVLEGHGEQVTVLNAVALAHGVTAFAKLDDTVIMRNNPATGKRDTIPIRLKEIQNHKAPDVPLESNDILYVPDSRGKKALAKTGEAMLGIGTSVAIYRGAYQ